MFELHEVFYVYAKKANQSVIFLIYANRRMEYSLNKPISVFVWGQRCEHNEPMNDLRICFLYIALDKYIDDCGSVTDSILFLI